MNLAADVSALFYVFRYQILPINRNVSGGLFADGAQVDELLAKKNEYFSDALLSAKRLISKSVGVSHDLIFRSGEFYLYRIAAHRHIRRETEDFKKEHIDNWPSILVAVWNDADKQLVAVQRRISAFAYPTTPAKIIEATVNLGLAKKGLRAHVEPLFDESAFWQLINSYRSRIKKLTFDLVTPNMSNISASLDKNLKDLAKGTNTAKTNLSLEADPSSVLNVDQGNKSVSSLVDYASQGGGDISIKVRGVRKIFKAQKEVRQIEVDGLSISGHPEQVAKVLKEVMGLE